MGPKNQEKSLKSDSDDQDISNDQEDQLLIQEEVINKIKQLPTLKEKVQAIAINSHLEKKRKLDQKLQKQTEIISRNFITSMTPHINTINQIISGTYNFLDQDFDESNQILTGEELATKGTYTTKAQIPQYWLKVLINSESLGQEVHPADEPILKHLQRIEGQKSNDLTSLKITFYFSENQWFSNVKITKFFDLEQNQIKKSYGDQINWKNGKDVTVKTVKKKTKKGTKTKVLKQPSFFNLFKSIEIDSSNQDNDKQADSSNQDDQTEQLQNQYQICQTIFEEILPNSLLYYLGINVLKDCCSKKQCDDGECAKKSQKKKRKNSQDDD